MSEEKREDLKFVAKISKQGDKKIIIIPKNFHKMLEKEGFDDKDAITVIINKI